MRHTWPGNARELENAVERGAVLARGERIEIEDLLLGDGEARAGPAPAAAPADETLRGSACPCSLRTADLPAAVQAAMAS